MHTLNRVLRFLEKLDTQKIHYQLLHSREDSLMIRADVPGEKWEIEFMADGTIEIEVFSSNGTIQDEEALRTFFKKHGEPSASLRMKAELKKMSRKKRGRSANKAL